MLLTIIDKSVKICTGFLLVAKCTECKAGIINFIGFGIVIIHCCGRFGGTKRCLLEAIASAILGTLCLVANAEQEVEIIFLCAIELAFAKVMRIYKALVEQTYSLIITPVGNCELCKFHTGSLVLHGHFAFAALPWVELVRIEFTTCFGIVPGLVEKCYLFKHKVVALPYQLGIILQERQPLGMRAWRS